MAERSEEGMPDEHIPHPQADVLKYVPETMAALFTIFPLSLANGTLTVALASDEEDQQAAEMAENDLRNFLGLQIAVNRTYTAAQIKKAIETHYEDPECDEGCLVGIQDDADTYRFILDEEGLEQLAQEGLPRPSRESLEMVPETMASLYEIVPLSLKDGVLTVAVPMDVEYEEGRLDDLRNFLGVEVAFDRTYTLEQIQETISRAYTAGPEAERIFGIEDEFPYGVDGGDGANFEDDQDPDDR